MPIRPLLTTLASTLLLIAAPGFAQEPFDYDGAAEQLAEMAALVEREDIDSEELNSHRRSVSRIESAAFECEMQAAIVRERFEELYDPLRDQPSDEITGEARQQRQSIAAGMDDAIARQASCSQIVADAQALGSRISNRQQQISEQFLSARTDNVFQILEHLPERAATWPERIRDQADLTLAGDLSRTAFAWMLLFAGVAATVGGVFIRRRFLSWYAAEGGDDAEPQLRHLLPKPMADFAPLLLAGAALCSVTWLAVADVSTDLVLVRIALAIFGYGACAVVIHWASGPLSPAADVKGFVPDHVVPFRRRLFAYAFVLLFGYIVIGDHWLAVRGAQTYTPGYAGMILLTAVSLLRIVNYLPRIPGFSGRLRLLRFVTTSLLLIAILALATGYQNLAGYLVNGLSLTSIAVLIMWMLFWQVFAAFNYLLEKNTDTAVQVRSALGVTGKGSGTGIGFMQLIADVVLWIGFLVFLIYVWDTTGATLGRLELSITEGWTVGGVSFVPMKIVGGILVFVVLVIFVGWAKRWIDRRWLQRIVIDRGGRDAILTLFGYIAFILAILLSLKAASVDLTGLAIVSGALALGLGFGLQSIANNFVSGLILLFERPIRAGDFVTVGTTEGYVRSIRIRATEIETLDNQNVLVPNSELVSGRVTNWVLRDTHGRLQVRVGVAYGTDVDRVREILERVGREHSEVISDGRAPAPKAFFMGFGDSALEFELRVRVQRIERRFSVLSDMNFAIDREFREAGIVVPFPQRDLHIVSYPGEETVEPKVDTESAEPQLAANEVTRSHHLDLDTQAPRTEVWEALTTSEQLKRWLVRDGNVEARIGGAVHLALRDGYEITGRIDIYIPERRLRVVVAPAEGEEPLATGPITVDLRVRERDEKTRLSVDVSGIPGTEDWEEYYRLSVDRWKQAFSELAADVLRS